MFSAECCHPSTLLRMTGERHGGLSLFRQSRDLTMTGLFFISLFLILTVPTFAYDGFKTAVYCTRQDVQKLSDKTYFKQSLSALRQHFQIDKVYLEIHRRTSNDEKTMRIVKQYFENEGIATAGGITPTGERENADHFTVLCYSDEQQVNMLIKAVETAAEVFDECILDDFFFTSCKCDRCIAAKGDMTWHDFRLKRMTEVSGRLVKAAKKINPKIKIVIKYPNWYPYFRNTGYNLTTQPQIFDGIYTGTETRDPVYTHQNLQPYQSYSIIRYLENTAPGKNGAGWVDPLRRRTMDRYSQQLALTLFAGAREITLFHWSALYRSLPSGGLLADIGAAAGSTFKLVDSFAKQLGRPEGLPVYRPHNSSGENYLTSYLGMLGIPLELTPYFPKRAKTVLLTASAAADPQLMDKAEDFLSKGGRLIITSGLLKALSSKSIGELISADVRGYVSVNRTSDLNFSRVFTLPHPVRIPFIEAPTNDNWNEVLALSRGGNSYPLLTTTTYSAGKVLLLTIPDDFSDFYAFPAETLFRIKRYLLEDSYILLNAPPRVALFLYDNNTLIVQSFLEHREKASLHFKRPVKLWDVLSGRDVSSCQKKGETVFDLFLNANQFRVLHYED